MLLVLSMWIEVCSRGELRAAEMLIITGQSVTDDTQSICLFGKCYISVVFLQTLEQCAEVQGGRQLCAASDSRFCISERAQHLSVCFPHAQAWRQISHSFCLWLCVSASSGCAVKLFASLCCSIMTCGQGVIPIQGTESCVSPTAWCCAHGNQLAYIKLH